MFVNKAVFLDRDGVINIEKNYVCKIEDFEFQQGVFEAAKYFQNKGFLVIVVTNQSGIGRGYYREDEFQNVTAYMLSEFEKHGVKITKVYHCPHSPDDGCNCRKPNPGMFISAKNEFNIDMGSSWMIGDKEGDIKAANGAGVSQTILVKSGHKIDEKNTKAAFVVNGVFDTIGIIK
jgi:D-glycero-D-manno-heptose 1,7-bisphosphate phosphatase